MEFTVEHLGLPAANTVTLKNWYVDKLDAKVLFESDGQPPAFFLDLNGIILEIYPATATLPDTSNNSVAGFRHLALQVDSIELAQGVLARKGIKFNHPIKPAGGGGRVLFFQDAEQNLLHLVERPAGSIFLK